ncbi:MAG: pantoate--beta-alanine ligase [Chloroflexota bacterium]|nr:pantoate--beta-alanine ligase [Chloroflexota bacterium]MDE2885002.1 pantoate--beta-alanine ligase [Chloroflexota bacterium]
MRQVETVAALRAALRDAPRPVGLVPTMGALHGGHLALVRAARDECATVTATIFVNPTQFGPNEDLDRYPRPLATDLELLERDGVDCVFTPSVDEMYPAGFVTTVHLDGPALPLEGAARPGHFDGVATVVAKLLLQSLPDRAYLGRKDGQQTAVVRRLVRDLDIPTEIVIVPTVREADGLAMSSRNAYLTPEQRAAAPLVFRALSAARDRFRSGQQDVAALEETARRMIEASPLASVEYVAGVDPDTMESWTGSGPCMLAAAVRIGSVRLIDNVILD